jgi:hypothetical protein
MYAIMKGPGKLKELRGEARDPCPGTWMGSGKTSLNTHTALQGRRSFL